MKINFNMVKKLNKKATDEIILSPFYFLMLGIIGIAIVTSVVVVLTSNSDIRLGEAKTLNDRMIYAIDNNGYLSEDIIQGKFDIFNESNINSQLFQSTNYFYINIQIYDENNQLKYSFIKGNPDFLFQCSLNGDKFAKCYTRNIALLNPDEQSKLFRAQILTGVNAVNTK